MNQILLRTNYRNYRSSSCSSNGLYFTSGSFSYSSGHNISISWSKIWTFYLSLSWSKYDFLFYSSSRSTKHLKSWSISVSSPNLIK